MTFAIDARAAAEVPAGRGRYVRELLAAFDRLGGEDELRLLARRPHGQLSARFRWDLIAAPDPLWHVRAARRASATSRALLSTNSYLTAWMTSIPTVVVVHDLVSFIEPAWAQPRAGRIERATLGRAVARSAAFICVSDATRRDLVERFPQAASRATTVPLAAQPALARPAEPAQLGRPYVLAVGTLEPRKNVAALIEAFAALPDAVRGAHCLALVGPRGWQVDGILATAAARPQDVVVLGHVSDDELRGLYAGAACFAYPSLYEGFGLPVLEAMTAGAPVVTSDRSSLPEVAGDAAVLVDPTDVASIRDGLAAVLTDDRRAAQLRVAGRRRAAAFSWERTAQETLDVLRQVADR